MKKGIFDVYFVLIQNTLKTYPSDLITLFTRILLKSNFEAMVGCDRGGQASSVSIQLCRRKLLFTDLSYYTYFDVHYISRLSGIISYSL